MNKQKIWVKYAGYATIEIEADTIEEAMNKFADNQSDYPFPFGHELTEEFYELEETQPVEYNADLLSKNTQDILS